MTNSTLSALPQPEDNSTDPLIDLLQAGARDLIAQAVEAEPQALLAHHAQLKLPDGRQAVVRNSFLPERTIQTGIGNVEIKVPKVRDRNGSGRCVFQTPTYRVGHYSHKWRPIDQTLLSGESSSCGWNDAHQITGPAGAQPAGSPPPAVSPSDIEPIGSWWVSSTPRRSATSRISRPGSGHPGRWARRSWRNDTTVVTVRCRH